MSSDMFEVTVTPDRTEAMDDLTAGIRVYCWRNIFTVEDNLDWFYGKGPK